MAEDGELTEELSVLRSKRDATRYQVLVEVASRQPAVSQQEIADAIGVTAQAVSDYLSELTDRGHVSKRGRGRYEVTKEGVDWLLAQTADLREFVEFVSEEVLGGVDVGAAIATGSIAEGDTVGLTMRDGIERAAPVDDDHEGPTAVAVTDAAPGEAVGVTDFRGVFDYDPGPMTVMSIPPVTAGGSESANTERITTQVDAADVFAVAGTEALVAAQHAERSPDIRFGAGEAAVEAATRGLAVFLMATATELPTITASLRDRGIPYEVIEAK